MAAPRTCGASSRAAKRALLEPCILSVVAGEVGREVGRGRSVVGLRVTRDVMLFPGEDGGGFILVCSPWSVLDVRGVRVCGGAIGTSKARWTGVD